MAYGTLATGMVVEEYDEAVAWGNRERSTSHRHWMTTRSHVYALTNIGAAELDAAMRVVGHARARAGAARIVSAWRTTSAARSLCSSSTGANRDFALTESTCEPGVVYCTERGLDTPRGICWPTARRSSSHRGDWDGAAESAGVILRDPRSPPRRVWALAALGKLLRARRGDPDASVPLEEAVPMVETTGELMQITPVVAARPRPPGSAETTRRWRACTDGPLALALPVGRVGWRANLPTGAGKPACATSCRVISTSGPYGLSMAGNCGGGR